jgi:glutaredoxin
MKRAHERRIGLWIGIALITAMALGPRMVVGEIYKWTDANGVVHYSDKPPEGSGAVKNLESMPSAPPSPEPPPKAKSEEPTGEKATAPEKKTETPSTRPKEAKVELFVTSWCKVCMIAKNYLRSKNVSFVEFDIEKDSAAAKRRRDLDKRTGVPLALINGTLILGFSEAAYAQALGR